MKQPLDAVVKFWAIIIFVGACIASTAVAFHRLTNVEEATVELRADQKFDHNLLVELKSDIRVMRQILERLDPAPPKRLTPQ